MSILPLAIGIIIHKKLDKPFKYLAAMIVVETIIAVYARHLSSQGLNNIPYLHLLTFLEVLLGGAFFYYTLSQKKLRVIVLISSVIFLALTSYNTFFIQGIREYNYLTRTIEGSLFVIFSFFYFYELIKSPTLISLSKSPTFWAVIAFFFYFGTSQFIHLFSEFMAAQNLKQYFIFNKIDRALIISYYLILATALWKKRYS